MACKNLRKIFSISLVLVLVIFLVMNAAISAKNVDLENKFTEYLNAYEQVHQFYGVVSIAQGGKIIYTGGYGMANIELNVPNTPKMKFQIGSITKQFTAAAIMQLAERGLLNVNDPISKYLPDYPKPNGEKITIRHLLTHTSGTPNYTDISSVWMRRSLLIAIPELLATFSSLPLEFEPGTQFKYSNSGYTLLGVIIEKVSGEAYDKYLQKHIFEPLEMKNSGYDNRRTVIMNRAAGYTVDTAGNFINAAYCDMTTVFSAGALYSTVGDMLIWDQALYTEKVLSKKSLVEMFTGNLSNYGYGFLIDTVFGRKHIWHNGGIDGFHATFERWVEDSLCVAVLSNNETGGAEMIAHNLAAIVFGEPYDIPVIKTPMALDTVKMKEYVGVFQIDTANYRIISYDNCQLYSHRTAGIRGRIFPEGKDKFYYESDNSITVTFVRDETGKIVKQIMHQMGVDNSVPKIEGTKADSLIAGSKAIQIDPQIFNRYVGDYQLAPQFILTIRTRDNRLFAQATGQSEFEIFPNSETEFFLRVVEAQVKFVIDSGGQVTGLVLHQNGQDIPGQKVK
jgi:CubicO group peptidase (beta-lactamase class C family)